MTPPGPSHCTRRNNKTKWTDRMRFQCGYPNCNFIAFRYRQLDEHTELTHLCIDCGESFLDNSDHAPHCNMIGAGRAANLGPGVNDIDTSFFHEANRIHRGVLVQYDYEPARRRFTMVSDFIDFIHYPLERLLRQLVDFYSGIQVSFRIITDLYEQKHDITEKNFPTGSPWNRIANKAFVNSVILNSISYIIVSLNQIINRSSEWCVLRIVRIEVLVGHLESLPGRGWLPTPKSLKGRRGLKNIVYKKEATNCFHLCLLAHLYGDEMTEELERQRQTSYPFEKSKQAAVIRRRQRNFVSGSNYEKYFSRNDYSFSGIDTNNGVTLLDLDIFEKNNPKVSISVYNEKSMPMRLTEKERAQHVDLLFIEKKLKYTSICHYVLIKEKSKFLGKHGVHKHLYCGSCANSFGSQKTIQEHVCGASGYKVRLPGKSPTYKFQKYTMTLRCPYIIYYSFKKLQLPMENNPQATEHVVVGYCLMLLGPEGILILETYFGENPVRHFLNLALDIAKGVVKKLKCTNNKQHPSREVLEAHQKAKNCAFCLELFTTENPKVFHHHHQYSDYLHTLCNNCNLATRQQFCVNAVSFGETKYEQQIIIQGFEGSLVRHTFPVTSRDGSLRGIKINKILKLTNASNFRPGSTLRDLTNEMLNANADFKLLNEYFRRIPEMVSHFQTLSQLFPRHESICEFKKVLNLPYVSNPETFTRESLESEFVNNLQKLKCATLKDFLDLQVKAETLILADIFEFFRDSSFSDYNLDPAHTYSLGGYSRHCGFFFDRVKVDLISNPEMEKMVNDGLRGGTTLLGIRHVKPNTRRYGEFDESREEVELLSCDMNSQYSAAMTENLPTRDFEFLSEDEIQNLDFLNMDTNGEFGIIARVSIIIPDYLHDLFASFPPICEKSLVSITNLSGEQKQFVAVSETKISFKEKRNLSTLFPKIEQVFYAKNIQFYARLGCIIWKVHSAFRFKQTPLFKKYVNYNNEKRKNATSLLMKNAYKLQNNILSGSLNIDPLSYSNNEFCLSSSRAKELLSRHNFLDVKPVANSRSISLFRMKKTQALDVNFRCIAMVIYELAKLKLLSFLYFKLIPKFGPQNLRVAHSHTDSLLCVLKVDAHTFIKYMKELADVMDFSNLPKEHVLYSTHNECVMGKMKMQDYITEFIGHNASQYSLKFADDSESCKCSGVPKQAQKAKFRHELYHEALAHGKRSQLEIQGVRMIDGKILNVTVNRFGLGGVDIARHFVSDNMSIPFGHWRLRQLSELVQ